jgi:hypothetical protein
MSQFHLLSDDEIIAALDDSSNIIRAVSFDRTTKFAVVGVPAHSPYLELSEFRRLFELLSSLGLKPRVYKASGSNDVQLFLYFSEPYKTDVVADSLVKVLSWNGFSLRSDKLIVYPANGGLPLPLQRGFGWLNEDLQPIVTRMEIALDSALALFCSEASRYTTDFERVIDGANLLPDAELTDAEFWGVAPTSVETVNGLNSGSKDDASEFETIDAVEPQMMADDDFESEVLLTHGFQPKLVTDDYSDVPEEFLEPTTEFSFACSIPAPQDSNEKSESLKAFPLWLVEEDLSVEVFPIPADQEVIDDMLSEDISDDLDLQIAAAQGQSDADELWPRQSSQLLLVTNESAPDLQLDLFSVRKNLNKGDGYTPRSRRKRPRLDETPNPEI